MPYICNHCGEPITGGQVAVTVIDGQLRYLHRQLHSQPGEPGLGDTCKDCYLEFAMQNNRVLSAVGLTVGELDRLVEAELMEMAGRLMRRG